MLFSNDYSVVEQTDVWVVWLTGGADDASVLFVDAWRGGRVIALTRHHVRLVAEAVEPTQPDVALAAPEVGAGARLATLQPQLAADDARVSVVEVVVAHAAPARAEEELDPPRRRVIAPHQAQHCAQALAQHTTGARWNSVTVVDDVYI